MSDFEIDERAGALWLTLRRPPVNVLDISTLREIRRALKGLPARHDLKVLVVRSGLLAIKNTSYIVRQEVWKVGADVKVAEANIVFVAVGQDGRPVRAAAPIKRHGGINC